MMCSHGFIMDIWASVSAPAKLQKGGNHHDTTSSWDSYCLGPVQSCSNSHQSDKQRDKQRDKQSDKVWQSNSINSMSMFSLCTGVSSKPARQGQDNVLCQSMSVYVLYKQINQNNVSAVILWTKQQDNGGRMVAGQTLLLDFHVRDSAIMALAAPRHVQSYPSPAKKDTANPFQKKSSKSQHCQKSIRYSPYSNIFQYSIYHQHSRTCHNKRFTIPAWKIQTNVLFVRYGLNRGRNAGHAGVIAEAKFKSNIKNI